MITRRIAAASMAILMITSLTLQAEDRIKVLIVDGQNNHNWKATTPVMVR